MRQTLLPLHLPDGQGPPKKNSPRRDPAKGALAPCHLLQGHRPMMNFKDTTCNSFSEGFSEAGLGCPWVYTKAKAHIILLEAKKNHKSAAPRVKLELCETSTAKKNAPATVVAGLKFGT